jgi:hypothetical protein
MRELLKDPDRRQSLADVRVALHEVSEEQESGAAASAVGLAPLRARHVRL